MNIRNRRAIHETAANTLRHAPAASQIILIYALICCGLSLGGSLISALLSDRISGTGGLGNIGLRSVLSTGQSVLPLVTFIVTTCLNLGYHTALLCFIRGFDASTQTLFGSFRHFGPLLRSILLQGVVYFAVGIAATYLSSFIFMMTPFAAKFMEVMEPVLTSMTVMDSSFMLDETTLMAAMEAMIPMLWILLALCLVLMVPISYRFRMVMFALADDPRKGARHALRKSRFLMRKNCFALFRLDLDLWWYYLGVFLINAVCYGDVLLPMIGINLPWNSTVSFYAFFLLSLSLQFALQYFAMNRVYTVYAVAYDALQEDLIRTNYPAQM